MQLACPACQTAFHVEPLALGDEGRTVRCARCRNTWFAELKDLIPGSGMTLVSAEGEALPRGYVPPAMGLIEPVVAWNDMVMVELDSGPPLVPGSPSGIVPAVQTAAPTGAARPKGGARAVQETRLGLLALLLGAIIVIGVTAREPLVRAVPGLANFYAIVGLPVNLRGIEFSNLRTSHETQDGTPVLVIEGELINPTRYTRDLPRLRIAVQEAGGRELYAWNALLPRETLLARETLTFRSRLASPPEGSALVNVRFLHRNDLTTGPQEH